MIGVTAPGTGEPASEEDVQVRLGVVTDEVSPDPREALRWAREHGLDYIDVRDVWGRNVAELAPAELDELAAAVAAAGLPVMTVCPQLFRAQLVPEQVRSAAGEYGEHLRLLEAALEAARRLGAPYVRTFAFWREYEPDEVWDTLVAAFRPAAQLAAAAGRTLLLENEAITCAMSGGEAARLIRAVDSPHLQAIWDPANAFHHPEVPYPDGYGALRGLIRVVHAKDATEAGFTVLGQGQIDWRGQLAALAADGFDGGISVEPRHAPDGGTVAQASAAILAYLRERLRAS